jgi:hypothetical protein
MPVSRDETVRNLGSTYGDEWQLDAPAAFSLETQPPLTTEQRSGWASETVWTLHMSDKSTATVENRNVSLRLQRAA